MRTLKKAPNRADAERIALEALAFLAEDAARLARFLTLTGIGPSELRAAAADGTINGPVLDHLMADESLLLVFAAERGHTPRDIEIAHALLTGRREAEEA